MIRVTLYSQGDKITGFECQGHAGFDRAGRDIVCAAVSVLATTCVNALEAVAGIQPKVKASSGSMTVQVPPDAGHDAQVILKTFRQGIRDIAEEYAPYLLLNELQA